MLLKYCLKVCSYCPVCFQRKPPLGISMLQFCYAHIQHSPGSQLLHSWPAMLALLKDALQLAISPPAQFLLLA